MSKLYKIALAGEGGQGVQSVANILAEAANDNGLEAIYIPNFGVEQRGGVSIAYVQIDEKVIGSPKFKTADIVVALSGRAIERTKRYVGPETVFIYDSSTIQAINEDEESDYKITLPENAKAVIGIPANEIAKEELHPRVFNIMILGAVIKATGVLPVEKIKEAIEAKLGYKFEQNPELRELNFKALERGMSLVEKVL
ncbi:2-oxoglutarate ferredoxin oxidoreductase subunit gamma [Anaerobranca californiensis DSM 14826]|jgi:2-oxoglutarate ferredoxin oxidoreductase subunit gamma|uniref:2-oxoglutarate ferredoxin oxidoreductase subunit gamma n=1 Tax=Anaerobranca californiensis DSM 14826 TaxID=1120989 RepID=A0A1M6R6Q9_9FIRM|nr:2-oxoacid:acceptor oxidoreductase family protein [Anaerobranca californiensis]SHK28161.1 2-oxoglutarate ferredoxin oxidoreductase subunit gamma [Anaerobranca californiensis DSM 14826]